MEKLVYFAIGILIAGIVLLIGGGYLLHTAINDGNFWKGLVGVACLVIGLIWTTASAAAFR